ncbi:MAG: PLP-dependent transferase [Atopobiaceae bacterium]|nr:PLP-dependent transferase [Atopobiaceae bacterium]MBR1829830.1 PLP-dependent transferase [Atopobiaceae bacterium]
MDFSLDGLKELSAQMGAERWRVVSDVAQVVANYLRCHPRVEVVRYPGLKSDPLFEQAARTLVGGFGPVVCYQAEGEWHRLECGPRDAKELILELEARLS